MNRVAKQGDYCYQHKGEQAQQQSQRKNNNNYGTKKPWAYLYNSSAWRKLRALVIRRDEGRCALCGSAEQLVVDHIVPHRGNEELFYDADNLITLCKVCHDHKTRQEIIQRKKAEAKAKKKK